MVIGIFLWPQRHKVARQNLSQERTTVGAECEFAVNNFRDCALQFPICKQPVFLLGFNMLQL